MTKKGFTLLELLIVIAILAILAAAAVVVLNPAELLRRARDSQRITDMANIRNSINLYLTTVSTINMDVTTGCQDAAANSKLFRHNTSAAWASTANDGLNNAGTIIASSSRVTTGAGWIPINFDLTAGGSPLSAIPIDPTADSDNVYYYLCSSDSSSTYELGAFMESATYDNGGDDDVESTDGGDGTEVYEVGNEPGLDLGA